MLNSNIPESHIQCEFFPTPSEPIISLLNNYPINPQHILEPCAGNGAISKAIRSHFPKSTTESITQIEIRQEEAPKLSEFGSVIITDFLTWTPPSELPPFSAIVTNPPFSKAQSFIGHCFQIAPGVPVIMLLRLGFLSSQKRKDWVNANPPTDLLVLSKRPSFHPLGKRDITDYAWIVWNGNGAGIRSI